MRYCILIPTINRADLLADALYYYEQHLPEIKVFVLDNGSQSISSRKNIKVLSGMIPRGVAASWNFLIDVGISNGFEYFLILNDDIILKKPSGVISRIIQTHKDSVMHIPKPSFHLSAFILSKNIYNKVGGFDEHFKKCFFEDNDYKYRVKLAGFEIRYENELNADVFRNSQTIEKDPKLGGYLENREYYIKKWGGLPDEEKYKTPFDGQPN